ncbi:hypothetical protein CROQUDRAFT_99009 [Cronartium quercuum f. sp. fusiforme G11]|uniref:Uncharacterized protein n=1 Tax=Cronartium quercuum f. sp. fusiforme G11 TaxID=708437 RepID=A0A9P6T887_9BASI|nr:hypothetical protein CROQUDRAFT_99009 [Cronartium quercuum f. sp. fusiforme G11]
MSELHLCIVHILFAERSSTHRLRCYTRRPSVRAPGIDQPKDCQYDKFGTEDHAELAHNGMMRNLRDMIWSVP